MTIDVSSILRWLVDGARTAASPRDTLAQLCAKLTGAGIRLDRAGVYVQTLHPNIMGWAFRWRPGEEVEVAEAPIEMLATDRYQASPVALLRTNPTPIRRQLADAACPLDFPVLKELCDEGFTDYLCAPLIFSDGDTHAASWSTKAEGGFTEAEIAGLEAIHPPLARVAEIWSLRRVAVTLLDTYVGRQSGARVLAGHIQRGDIEEIEAVIWLSDLRDFTPMTDRLPAPEVISRLNRFFDGQMPAIHAGGGEVLKFVGDGLLAIFPVGGDRSAAAACEAALTAAHATQAALAETAPDLPYGLALHAGKLAYGNIGSGDRLDFTCIGPAINLAARLEKLSGALKRPVVASQAFVRCAPQAFDHLGDFPLKGFGGKQPVYGLTAQRGASDGVNR